jgi:hypothetical protein
MEHERIQRTSSWRPTFQKREPASVEPALTVQKQTAPTPSPDTLGTYTPPSAIRLGAARPGDEKNYDQQPGNDENFAIAVRTGDCNRG